MEIFILKEGTNYNPESRTDWTHITMDMTVDEAIAKFAGKTTLMLQWFDEGSLFCITITSAEDHTRFSKKLPKAWRHC